MSMSFEWQSCTLSCKSVEQVWLLFIVVDTPGNYQTNPKQKLYLVELYSITNYCKW